MVFPPIRQLLSVSTSDNILYPFHTVITVRKLPCSKIIVKVLFNMKLWKSHTAHTNTFESQSTDDPEPFSSSWLSLQVYTISKRESYVAIGLLPVKLKSNGIIVIEFHRFFYRTSKIIEVTR